VKPITPIIAALIAMLAMTVLAQPSTSDSPFKHPRAVQAWKRYQHREQKAREAYEREMRAAREEYVASLNDAAALVIKTGDAEELKNIAEAKASVSDVVIQGRLHVHYNNGHENVYEIANGSFSHVSSTGKVRAGTLRRVGESVVLQFADGRIERLTPVGGGIFSEYFQDASAYNQAKPSEVGAGVIE
jgi:hypothetical protein